MKHTLFVNSSFISNPLETLSPSSEVECSQKAEGHTKASCIVGNKCFLLDFKTIAYHTKETEPNPVKCFHGSVLKIYGVTYPPGSYIPKYTNKGELKWMRVNMKFYVNSECKSK